MLKTEEPLRNTSWMPKSQSEPAFLPSGIPPLWRCSLRTRGNRFAGCQAVPCLHPADRSAKDCTLLEQVRKSQPWESNGIRIEAENCRRDLPSHKKILPLCPGCLSPALRPAPQFGNDRYVRLLYKLLPHETVHERLLQPMQQTANSKELSILGCTIKGKQILEFQYVSPSCITALQNVSNA